jgi:hypothetical protein
LHGCFIHDFLLNWMMYYLRYVTGMKKVVYEVSSLHLVFDLVVISLPQCQTFVDTNITMSSLVRLLWFKMTGVSNTLTKRTPCVLVIINPCPCGFTSDYVHPSFILVAKQWCQCRPHTKACFCLQVLINSRHHPDPRIKKEIAPTFISPRSKKWSS